MGTTLGAWVNLARMTEGVTYLTKGKANSVSRDLDARDHRVARTLIGNLPPAMTEAFDELDEDARVRASAAVLDQLAREARTGRPGVRNTLNFVAEEWEKLGSDDEARDGAAQSYIEAVLKKSGLEGQPYYAVRHMDTGNPHYHLTVCLVQDGRRRDPGRAFFRVSRDAVQERDIELGFAPALTRYQGNEKALGYLSRDEAEHMKRLGISREEYRQRHPIRELAADPELAQEIRSARGWDEFLHAIERRELHFVRTPRGAVLEDANGLRLKLSAFGKLDQDGTNISFRNLERRWGAFPDEPMALTETLREGRTMSRRPQSPVQEPETDTEPMLSNQAARTLVEEAEAFIRLHRTPDGKSWSFDTGTDDFERARKMWGKSRDAFTLVQRAVKAKDWDKARRLRRDAFRARTAAIKEQAKALDRREARLMWSALYDRHGKRRTPERLGSTRMQSLLSAFARMEGRDLTGRGQYAGVRHTVARAAGDALTRARREYGLAALRGDRSTMNAKAIELASIRADLTEKAAERVRSAGRFNLTRELMDEIAQPLLSMMMVPAALTRLRWAMTHPAQVTKFLARSLSEMTAQAALMPEASKRRLAAKLEAIERARALHQGGKPALDALAKGIDFAKEREREPSPAPKPQPERSPTSKNVPVPERHTEATDKAAQHAQERQKTERTVSALEAAATELQKARSQFLKARQREAALGSDLARLDPTQINARLTEAQAALKKAHRQLPDFVGQARAYAASLEDRTESDAYIKKTTEDITRRYGRESGRAFSESLMGLNQLDDRQKLMTEKAFASAEADKAALAVTQAEDRARPFFKDISPKAIERTLEDELLAKSPNDLSPEDRQRQAELKRKREREMERSLKRNGPDISF